jgi:2,4-dienoyl-CoA reductase (NADPH2)
VQYAKLLAPSGVAYISVMGGTYESFSLPDIIEKSKQPAYMLDLAAAVKKHVDVPVISAGRFSTGAVAEKALAEGKADLIGLARVLWADPQWPEKVRTGRESEIVHCDPECPGACTQMVMKGRPAFCVQWPPEKIKEWKAKYV